jgi:hypothetical protein
MFHGLCGQDGVLVVEGSFTEVEKEVRQKRMGINESKVTVSTNLVGMTAFQGGF